MIPTEKAIICMSFVCYVHILFMFWLHIVVLRKTRKLQYTNRVNLSVFTVHLTDTFLQSFTLFIKYTLADIIIILWLLKLGITMIIHNKDDIQFVTEFPYFLGHPLVLAYKLHWLKNGMKKFRTIISKFVDSRSI